MHIHHFQEIQITKAEAEDIRGGIHIQFDRKGLRLDLRNPEVITYRFKPSIGFVLKNWKALSPHIKAILPHASAIGKAAFRDSFPNPFKLLKPIKGSISLSSLLDDSQTN